MLSFDIFQRIFVRAIFKESLIEVIHDIKHKSFIANLAADKRNERGKSVDDRQLEG